MLVSLYNISPLVKRRKNMFFSCTGGVGKLKSYSCSASDQKQSRHVKKATSQGDSIPLKTVKKKKYVFQSLYHFLSGAMSSAIYRVICNRVICAQ